MTPPSHDEVAELVAAYALDSVEADEARLVEDHLRECPRCRAELADHQDTAALLAHPGSEAPVGVWERIAAELGAQPEAPPMRVVVGAGETASRVPRRWVVQTVAAAAAVVIAVMGVMGASLVRTEHRVGQLSSALAADRGLERAAAAALDPRARRVALTASNGAAVAEAAVLPDGTAYVIPAGLGALSSSRTYQLWSIVAGRSVSAGLLGADPRVTAFRVAPGATALALTDEPAGGSPQPTSAPVGSGAI
ncbi:MAG TPA: anti-sigma factor [Acidimicrobiales bacterium]|nr:anti-sigma factor [Acidimicrobiales bacterium]